MKLQTAKGVRDIPPEDKIIKNKVLNTLTTTFERFGFAPLETPILERYDTLTAKGGAGEDSDAFKEIFRLTDQGKRDLGLRFDLTVPLARFAGMNPNLKLPFKRYAAGRVFRDGPIKLGRYREFWQCDADIVGTTSMMADAECLAILDNAFKTLGFDVVIKTNNRKLLNGILEQAGIKDKEQAIIAIDKLEKIGKDGVTKELQERGYGPKEIDAVFSLIKEGITLDELKGSITTDIGKEGLEELDQLFTYLKEMNVTTVQFDVSMARGLAYYTGTVFEVFLADGSFTSSLAGGGRYDELVKTLGGPDIPAVGLSFGLEPIIDLMKRDREKEVKTPAQVYIVPIKTEVESLAIARELREQGINVSFSIGKKGVSKNLQYASALGIPYVAIIGPQEIEQKKVLLRNMDTGDEQLLSISSVVKKLQ